MARKKNNQTPKTPAGAGPIPADLTELAIDSLTLALLRMTGRRKLSDGQVRLVSPLRHDAMALDDLEAQGLVRRLSPDGDIELTEGGYQLGDYFAAVASTALLDAFRDFASQEGAGEGPATAPGTTSIGNLRVVEGGRSTPEDARPTFDPLEHRTDPDSRAFRLRIQLKLGKRLPRCWREIEIPARRSFLDLHLAIQRIFNWYDEHLFHFELTAYGQKLKVEQNYFLGPGATCVAPPDTAVVEADKLLLGDVFPQTTSALYLYDYGDGWEHKITLVETIDKTRLKNPRLTGGTGDAPPEDVGGIGGFEDFLKVVTDKNDPHHLDALIWADEQMARPFDLGEKQRELAGHFKQDHDRWKNAISQYAR